MQDVHRGVALRVLKLCYIVARICCFHFHLHEKRYFGFRYSSCFAESASC